MHSSIDYVDGMIIREIVDRISEFLFKVEVTTLKIWSCHLFSSKCFENMRGYMRLCNKCYSCMYNGRLGHSLNQKKLIPEPLTGENIKI